MSPESMSEEEMGAARRAAAKKAEEEFQLEYFGLGKWFERFDPLYVLAYCALYFTSHPEGIDPEAEGSLDFYEYHLELLQAFALTRERSPKRNLLGEDGEVLRELMQRIGSAMTIRGLHERESSSDREFSQNYVLSLMRSQTQIVRNWGYAEHVRFVVGDLAAAIRNEFFAEYGVDPVRLVDTFFLLAQSADDSLNDHLHRIWNFYRQGNYEEVASAYIESFPDTGDFDAEELFNFCGRKLKHLKNLLVQNADLSLSKVFSFNVDDIVKAYGDGGDEQAILRVFDGLSLEFGDLEDHDVEHFILDNPVLTKPFIKVDHQTYYSVMLGIMPHCILRILERLVQSIPSLDEKYRYKKARYLEDELEILFNESFPSGKVYRGSLWNNDSGANGENDLTIVVGSVAIIVEAKSGMVTPPASRGAPDRFRRTVRELIDDPADQAHKFIALLRTHGGTVVLQNREGSINEIDTAGLRYFIPLTVTLENLGAVSNLRDLVEAGISRRQLHELSTVICLTDLMVIFEVLELQSQRIHYLGRRREFDARVHHYGDELDILAYYLKNGLNIGELEYESDKALVLSPLSKELDPYFVAKSAGLSIEKPTLNMAPMWRATLARLDVAQGEPWLDASLILLNVSHKLQLKIEKALLRLSRKVKRGKTKMPYNWAAIVTLPPQRQFYVAFCPYIGIQKDERNALIQDILGRQEAQESRGALCIGIDLEHPEEPYDVVAGRPSPNLFDELL